MSYVYTLSLLLLLSPCLWAQRIAKTKALEDLKFLDQAVVNGHPVNYNPALRKVTLLPSLQKLNAIQQDSLTLAQFRLLLQEAIFSIGCVHTRISNAPARKSIPHQGLLPTSLLIRNGILVDTLNRNIQSINGITAQQLIDEIGYFYASDGITTALSTAVFNRNSSWLIAQYLDYPPTYTIRLDTTSLLLNAGNPPHIAPAAPTPYGVKMLFTNADNVFYLTPTVPVLKLTQFHKNDRAMLKQTFRYLERAQSKNLILDLRGNLGGHRASAVALTQHLLEKSFNYAILQPKLATRQYLTSRGQLSFFLSKLKYNVGNICIGQKTALGRQFVYRYQPKKTTFTGQVYVLTDGYTASASTMVTSWLKQHTSARFVGQQSGGGYNGNNAGSFGLVILPNTKYEISWPAYRLILNSGSDQSKGLVPDVVTEAELTGETPLSRAIALIGSTVE